MMREDIQRNIIREEMDGDDDGQKEDKKKNPKTQATLH